MMSLLDYVKYKNAGAVRSLPVSNRLTEAMSFLPKLGVTMEVFSGGQPAKGTSSRRVGSTRHDHGNAADVFFYKDGKKLDWQNPADRPLFEQIVAQGKQAGLTGFGAGPNYMQPGSMHIGFGKPGVWGAGGRGANAPEWLRNAYYNGVPTSNNPVTQPTPTPQQPTQPQQPVQQAQTAYHNGLPVTATQAPQTQTAQSVGQPTAAPTVTPTAATTSGANQMPTLLDLLRDVDGPGSYNDAMIRNRLVTDGSPVTLDQAPQSQAPTGGSGQSGAFASFNPGMALQAFGAAIAAGSQGRSAAEDLAGIQQQHFGMQAQRSKAAQEARQREALVNMFGSDSPYAQALAAGASPSDVMQLYSQQQRFASDQMQLQQQQQFTAGQNDMDRQLARERLGLSRQADAEKRDSIAASGEVAKQSAIAAANAAGNQALAAKFAEMPPEAFTNKDVLNTIDDNLKVGTTQQTSDQKNFKYYQDLLAAGKPEEAESFRKQVMTKGGSSVLDEERIKSDLRLTTEEVKAADNTQALDALDNMSAILDQNPNVETGALYEMFQQPLDVLNNLKLLPPGMATAQNSRAMIDQLNTYLATLIKTPGSISNYEQQSFKRANPGTGTPTENMRAAIQFNKTRLQRDKNRALFLRDRVSVGEPYSSAAKEWGEKLLRGDEDTSPIYANLDTHSKENIARMGLNKNDVVYINGAAFTLKTDKDIEMAKKYIEERGN